MNRIPLTALPFDIILNAKGYKTEWEEIDKQNYNLKIIAPAQIRSIDIDIQFALDDDAIVKEAASINGRKTSKRAAKASARNGKKGGRPRKSKVTA